MNHDVPAYGLWSLVVINTAVFLIFAFSFTRSHTARDWRLCCLSSRALLRYVNYVWLLNPLSQEVI